MLSSYCSGNRVCSDSRTLAIFLLPVALFVAGCAEAEQLVSDVSESVGEQVDSVSESVSDTVSEQVESVTADPVTQEPEPIDPQALLNELNSLQSMQISDTLLTQLAATPDAASQITELRLDGAAITDVGLQAIPSFTNLQTLSMRAMRTIGADITPVTQTPSIQSLDLSMSRADQSTLESLVAMPALKTLILDAMPMVRGGCGPTFAKMNLDTLSLAGVGFTDQDAAAISGTSIRSLDLRQSQLSNAGLVEIAKIKTLEELVVAQTIVKGAAFVVLKGSGLKSLDASHTEFGIAGLQAIKALKSLETLKLYQAAIVEDVNANVFKGMRNLKTLVLSRNKISDRGVQVFLSGHPTLEHLELRATPGITDASLGLLVKNKSLRYLDVSETTSCTAQGVQLFHEKRPDCVIESGHGRLGPEATDTGVSAGT